MAYDQTTGLWKPEDDSVEKRVTGLLASDNPLMTQARTTGAKKSNARGLLNSSMGVQAGEEAAYGVALPIASQDASQTHQKNLSGQGFAQDTNIQAQTITGQKELQAADLAAQQSRLDATIASSEKVAGLDNANKLAIANIDVESQQKIAGMNISSSEKQAATNAATNMAGVYANMFTAIMQNDKLPAATRDQMLEHISALNDSNIGLVEQFYNIDLNWASQTGGGGAGIGIGATGNGTTTTPKPPPAKPTSQPAKGFQWVLVNGSWIQQPGSATPNPWRY